MKNKTSGDHRNFSQSSFCCKRDVTEKKPKEKKNLNILLISPGSGTRRCCQLQLLEGAEGKAKNSCDKHTKTHLTKAKNKTKQAIHRVDLRKTVSLASVPQERVPIGGTKGKKIK